MKEIVINVMHGGFGLSHEAILRYAELKGIDLHWEMDKEWVMIRNKSRPGEDIPLESIHIRYYISPEFTDENYFWDRDIERDDPKLIQIIKELGGKANARFAKLKIVEIPDDIDWTIEEYDGAEWVAEKHRTFH